MAKEHFFIDGSREVLDLIDLAGRKAGVARGQAFEDFLTLVRCSLAGQTMEGEYLAVIQKGYGKGKKDCRGIDMIVQAFAKLVHLMEETNEDVLGDIFQGGITYGESGQFFTPAAISDLMARLSTDDIEVEIEGGNRNANPIEEPCSTHKPKSVCDPASGSGRCLLSIAKSHPNWEFTGQDVDHRCVQMTAINLGLRGLFGWAVWQNSLTLETHRVYKIGFNLNGGVIREIPIAASPFNYSAGLSNETSPAKSIDSTTPSETVQSNDDQQHSETNERDGASQLDLF